MEQFAQLRQESPVLLFPLKDDKQQSLRERLDAALATIAQMQSHIRHLEDDNRAVTLELEMTVQQQDLAARAMRNKNMSIAYRVMYIALVNTYPDVLKGVPVTVNICKIRENGGWVSESCGTKFMNALIALDAISYDPGKYDDKTNTRDGVIIANLSVFPFPEYFDTRKLEKETAARKKQKGKLDDMRRAWLILHCEQCGSPEIEYAVRPVCKKCGHRHDIIQGVTNDDFTKEGIDPFLDMMPDEETVPEPEPVEVKAAPVPFTAYQTGGKWPRRCRDHKNHRELWKVGIAGLECSRCGG